MNRNSPKAPEYTSELCKECVHFLGFYFLYINFISLKKYRVILFIQSLVEVVNFNVRKNRSILKWSQGNQSKMESFKTEYLA